MAILTTADFPLYSVGSSVYRRTESSPLFIAEDMNMAAALVMRLNRDEMANWGTRPPSMGVPMLVHGKW